MLRQAALLCRSYLYLDPVASAAGHVDVRSAACGVAQAISVHSSLSAALKPQQYRQTASEAVPAAAPDQATSGGVVIDQSAVRRLKELQAESPGKLVNLRVEVEGGGCSGFQYKFRLDDSITTDDHVFEREGVQVVCDSVSLDFLKGAVVEFEDSLMRSAFQIASNPNAEASCGCGTSFAAKM